MDTNKQLLTVDDLFRMQGRQPGFSPSDLQYEQAVKTVEALNKEKLSAMMMPEKNMPQFTSLTNAEGRVIDVMIKPNGEPVVVQPDTLNTQQGMFTRMNPTNAAPIVDPRTGDQVMGYAADPFGAGGAPAPLAGGGMAATNAPAAAPSPTATPTPSPTPSFVVEATADEIRQRFPQAPANLVPGMTIRLNNGGVIVVK
jgi:hypothetical protein